MFVKEIAPDVHVHAETEDALTLDRTDINFEDLTEDIVRITVRIHNRGWRRSAPTTVRLESAPLGAFVPWQSLAVLPVPPIEPGESRVVSLDALRPDASSLVKANRLFPAQQISLAEALERRGRAFEEAIIASRTGRIKTRRVPPAGVQRPAVQGPAIPQPPVRDIRFEKALAEWIEKRRARWRDGRGSSVKGPAMPQQPAAQGYLGRILAQNPAFRANAPLESWCSEAEIAAMRAAQPTLRPAPSAQPLTPFAALRQAALRRRIEKIAAQMRKIPAQPVAPGQPFSYFSIQKARAAEDAYTTSEIRRIMSGERPGPGGGWATPEGLEAGLRREYRQRLAARLRRQLMANQGRAAWRRPVLAPSPMDSPQRRHFYWAGNVNVFLGNRPPVERHMAKGTRIYPGLVSTVLFEVGGGKGPDAFSFQLKGSATAWQAGLHRAQRNMASIYGPPTGAAMEEGKWFETAQMMLITLRMNPPADCGPGDLDVHVTRRSCGTTTIVEFTLDPEAQGAGCYHA
jgi:hypothetical protein